MTSSTASDEAAERPARESRPEGERFPRAARLRHRRDILRVLRSGRRLPGPLVDVYAVSSPAGRPRVGVIVPRYGRTIVQRNRVRRRLREIARRDWLPLAFGSGVGLDLILKAKPSAYDRSLGTLRAAIAGRLEELCSAP